MVFLWYSSEALSCGFFGVCGFPRFLLLCCYFVMASCSCPQRFLGFVLFSFGFSVIFLWQLFHGTSVVVVIGFASFPLLLRCCSSFPNVILWSVILQWKNFSDKVYLSLTILCQVSQESDQPSSKILYLLTKSKIVKRIN